MGCVSIISCPVSRHYRGESGSLTFTPTNKVFVHSDESPESHLQIEQPQLSHPFLIWNTPSSWPWHWISSLVPGSPELDTVQQAWLHQCRVERKDVSLNMREALFLMQPMTLLASFPTQACCWLMASQLPTSTPRSFSVQPSPSQLASSMYWCLGVLPRCRIECFRSLWTSAQPFGLSATPPSSVSSANLLRVHPDPPSRSLKEDVEQYLKLQSLREDKVHVFLILSNAACWLLPQLFHLVAQLLSNCTLKECLILPN